MTTVRSKTTVAVVIVLGLWPTVARAQGTPAGPEPPAQTDQSAQQVPPDSAPYPNVPPLTEADRVAAFPDVRGHSMHESAINHFVLFDQFEWQAGDSGSGLRWENKGWIGGDLNRFWFRTEGDGEGGRLDTAFAHALYGRAIARWWDVVAGVRQDIRPGPVQTWAAVGIQGIAPNWFEVEVTAYVGAYGRTHIRFETEYELLLTNRLVLQPRVEFDIYGKSDPEHLVGAGLSTADAGIRVRYEFRREFAPYVGVGWTGNFFETADLAAAAGEKPKGARVSVGLRFWL